MTESRPMTARPGGIPVRFRILGLLFVLSFVNYLLRNNLSVALPSIHQEFGFSNTELGWILGSFNVVLRAVPDSRAACSATSYGPRRALTIIAVTWGVLTALTGFAARPAGRLSDGRDGRAHGDPLPDGHRERADVFPVSVGAIANWFPVGSWAFPNALLSSGLDARPGEPGSAGDAADR